MHVSHLGGEAKLFFFSSVYTCVRGGCAYLFFIVCYTFLCNKRKFSLDLFGYVVNTMLSVRLLIELSLVLERFIREVCVRI